MSGPLSWYVAEEELESDIMSLNVILVLPLDIRHGKERIIYFFLGSFFLLP